MSEYLIKQSTLTDIGNAIREKTGKTEQIPVINLANEISTISTGTDTSDATASAQDILSGKTAYVNGAKVTGSIPTVADFSNITLTSSDTRKVIVGKNDTDGIGGFWKVTNSDGVDRICTAIPTDGYYKASSNIIGFPTPAGLVADNIKKDANIFGVNGSYTDLNFEVVGGTSAPTNPKENTIWVDTNTGITGYQFSAEYQSKNLLKITGTTQTAGGLTFTPNSDGSIYVKGTPTQTYLNYYCTNIKLTKGKYIVSGGEDASGKAILQINIQDANGNTTYPRNTTFEITGTEKSVSILINSGKFTDPIDYTVYPMIRFASETDATWEPYGGAKEGFVWISTGESSPGAFNALKKNNVLLNPTSAKQYISGAWVDKTAKIYHNGAWVSWIVYLIKQGIDQTSVSGGWQAKAVPIYSGGNGHVGVSPTITVKDGYIEFKEPGYTASAYSGLAHTKNKIDLTGISKIKIYASGWYYTSSDYATASVSVWKSIGSAGIDNRVANVAITDLKEYILDVSAISGEHYIGVTVVNVMNGTSAYVNIYDLSYE